MRNETQSSIKEEKMTMKRIILRQIGLLATVALFTATGCGGCGNDNNENQNPNNMENNTSPNNTTPNNTTNCTAGEVGCACDADGGCAEGAACSGGMCVGAATSGLSVSSDLARSCEILLEEKGGKVLGATYGEGLKGALRRQSPNVAIAISASSDAAFPASVASIQIEGDASSVSVKEARCFDAAGEEIGDAEVTLK
jgi:hypothetical protein